MTAFPLRKRRIALRTKEMSPQPAENTECMY